MNLNEVLRGSPGHKLDYTNCEELLHITWLKIGMFYPGDVAFHLYCIRYPTRQFQLLRTGCEFGLMDSFT